MSRNLYNKNEQTKTVTNNGEQKQLHRDIEEDTFPEILPREVQKALKDAKAEKALGPDKISNKILKTFSEELEKPLTNIFNKILKDEIIANQWDVAEIIILHKKGDKNLLTIDQSA